jgi:hypothetical protein
MDCFRLAIYRIFYSKVLKRAKELENTRINYVRHILEAISYVQYIDIKMVNSGTEMLIKDALEISKVLGINYGLISAGDQNAILLVSKIITYRDGNDDDHKKFSEILDLYRKVK